MVRTGQVNSVEQDKASEAGARMRAAGLNTRGMVLKRATVCGREMRPRWRVCRAEARRRRGRSFRVSIGTWAGVMLFGKTTKQAALL